MGRFEDRVVLITGASSGVGAAAAEAFAREGAHLALLARGREGLERVARRVRRQGRRALVLPADVTDRAALERAVGRVERELGGIDVLVTGAAAMVFGRFEQVPPEAFDRTIAVTFTGTVDTIRAALPALERRQGTIVVLGSIMARLPWPSFSSYSAAKHALRGFVGALRVELRAAGRRCSTSPGSSPARSPSRCSCSPTGSTARASRTPRARARCGSRPAPAMRATACMGARACGRRCGCCAATPPATTLRPVSPTVEGAGVELAYAERGAGPAVLLVHGPASDALALAPVA